MSHTSSRAADERTTVQGFLDHHREVLRARCRGLTPEQLDTPLPPASMTLGGMLKHLAYVENWWSVGVLRGESPGEPWASVDWAADGDWDWHSAAHDSPEELWALYEAEVANADRVYASADLDDLAARADRRTGERVNVRWILMHLVEEYARHNGHADLIRESIDGTVGD